VADAPLLVDEQRLPVWPDGTKGSITHARTYCGVAVARSRDTAAIGIDVEDVPRFRPDLFGHILSPREVKTNLHGLSTDDRRASAAALFSAKEAFYKCLYPLTRTLLGFHDVDAELDRAADTFRVRLLVDFGAFPSGRSFEGRFGFRDNRVAAEMMLVGDS
jgi:4'-phosphopantetheinyl transferase EntD